MQPTCRRAASAASCIFLLLAWLFSAPSLTAQSRDLASFQDSLERIRDVDQLRSMLAHRSSRASEKSPVALTERGFVALRLWTLTSEKSHSRLAQESFKRAIKEQPGYGWAHYGLGLAYVEGPDINPGTFVLDDVLDNLTGNDVRTRAHSEFLKAMAGEPPVSRAADELAENAVAKNKRKPLEDAREALSEHTNSAPDDGAGWLALARIQTELGELDAASYAMDEALAHGIKPLDVAHVRAALLLRVPERAEEGAQAWFAGVGSLTTPMSEEYFAAISALLTKSERDAWQTMNLDQRKEYLRTFWDMRAALSGVSVTHRMSEHYRRLATARQMFYRINKFGAPDMNALKQLPYSHRLPYDDRGLIYIRHGAPRDRVGGLSSAEHESWAYASFNGLPRVFHFERDQDGMDYHLMYRLTCDSDWLSDRVMLDPRLGRLLAHCNQMDAMSASADARETAFEALATDSDYPRFTKELPFFFDLYTFRANEGRTSVVAAVAVPREKLNLSAVAANPAYRIDLSLILVDTLSRRVVRQDDSVALASQRAIRNDDLLRLHVEVAVPPSKSTLQRVIVSDPSEPGIGQLYGGPFPIPDYSGSRFMISDIVLAEPNVQGRWHRGGVNLALVPTGYFKGGSFNVFYEIYNIGTNASYVTEIEIEPMKKTGEKLKGIFGGGRNNIKFRFEGVATNAVNGTLQELRRVDAPLGPGTYRMRVMVKNSETGEMARNERVFSIP